MKLNELNKPSRFHYDFQWTLCTSTCMRVWSLCFPLDILPGEVSLFRAAWYSWCWWDHVAKKDELRTVLKLIKKLQLHFIWFSEKSPLSSRSLHLELSFYILTPLKALQEWSFWFGSSLLKDKKKKKTFSCWLLSLLSVRLAGYWHSLSKYFFWPQ